VRGAAAAAALLVLAGCGSHKPNAYAQANTALLDRLPVYPGAAAPKTTAGSGAATQFGARDWTLPAHARASRVVDWYVQKLRAQGWKVSEKSFDTIRATRARAALSVGVRGRTLELIANSRGG
jgi:hypothetical protein